MASASNQKDALRGGNLGKYLTSFDLAQRSFSKTIPQDRISGSHLAPLERIENLQDLLCLQKNPYFPAEKASA